tara:strand:- start:462 stop:641 length:180 start_codon:yes stop_codon:yes gene_type:complete
MAKKLKDYEKAGPKTISLLQFNKMLADLNEVSDHFGSKRKGRSELFRILKRHDIKVSSK